MTRLAMILLCAWVLWHEIQGPNGSVMETVGAFPSMEYVACMAEAKIQADASMRVLTSAGIKDAARHTVGGGESLIAIMEAGAFRFIYTCLPDTIDPREKR
jgi:hypothetical protein